MRDITNFSGWKTVKVHRWLKRYRIKRNKRLRRGKLAGITLNFLEREFKNKTKIQAAKELEVSRQSLHQKCL